MNIRSTLIAGAVFCITLTGSPAQAFDLQDAIENANNPKGKIVEVVNKLPRKWEVRTAVGFMDKYTASRVRYVKKCTGTAWRCLTIKPGKISGSSTGMYYGASQTIVVDLAKVKRYGFDNAKFRKYLIAHEFGHRCLPHSHGRNVMYKYAKRQGSYLPLALNRDQRVALKNC